VGAHLPKTISGFTQFLHLLLAPVVIYVGSPGGGVFAPAGLANTSGAEITESTPGRGSVMGGRVYRLTMRLPTDWVCLPLVRRGCAP